MMKRSTATLLAATALAGFLASAAPQAEAAVILMVGANTINDNGPGDINPIVGAITNVATGNGFALTINTGTSTGIPSIDISSDAVTSTAAGSLVVKFTDTGLTSPAAAANWLTQLSGNWSGGSASVQLQSYIDHTNTAFGQGTALANLNAIATPFALSSTNAGGAGTPFSITEVLTLTANGAGVNFSTDAQLSAVPTPEPMSVALLGLGLVGLGLTRLGKKA